MSTHRRRRTLVPAVLLAAVTGLGALTALPAAAQDDPTPAPATTPPTAPPTAPSTATATGPEAGTEVDPTLDPAAALERAEAFATGDLPGAGPLASVPGLGPALAARLPVRLRSGVDGSQVQRDLYRLADGLDGTDRARARALLARPTDGRRDALGDGYRAASRRTCGPHVCVHWVPTTSDAPPGRAWVRRTLRVVERVWRTEVGRLGYRAPLGDGTRGGDSRFDVYLSDLGSLGAYGYCTPERPGSGAADPARPARSGTSAGYCVLDDDFSAAQFAGVRPVRSLKVTAAHEFFHAVQLAYTVGADGWFAESTAVWMEGQVFGGIDDNRQYLPYGQLDGPSRPLDRFQPTGFAQYGNWVFWQRLSDRFGPRVVRRTWERAGRGDWSSEAVRTVLAGRRGGLAAAFADYGSALSDAATAFSEGDRWPAGQAPHPLLLGAAAPRAVVRTRLDHLTSRSILVSADPADPAGPLPAGTRLEVVVRGPASAATAPGAHLRIRRTDGRVTDRAVPLDRRGRGRSTTAFGSAGVESVTVTVANASTRFTCRSGTLLSCHGRPRDDDRRFRVVARLVS